MVAVRETEYGPADLAARAVASARGLRAACWKPLGRSSGLAPSSHSAAARDYEAPTNECLASLHELVAQMLERAMSPFLLDRFPVPVSLDEYDSTADAIEKQFTQLPGLVSIYRLGGVSAPGISDLDRLAVVSGTGPDWMIWPSLTERERYVALHTPFLADLATFTSHSPVLIPGAIGALGLGEAICVEDPPEVARFFGEADSESRLFSSCEFG